MAIREMMMIKKIWGNPDREVIFLGYPYSIYYFLDFSWWFFKRYGSIVRLFYYYQLKLTIELKPQ